jgi:AMP nucleosidase
MFVEKGIEVLTKAGVRDVRRFSVSSAALDHASEIYDGVTHAILARIEKLNSGERPDPQKSRYGYPVIGIPVGSSLPSQRKSFHRLPYGWFRRDNAVYASEVTQLELYRQYLLEELPPLLERYGTEILVGQSTKTGVPVDLALNGSGLEVAFDQDTVYEQFFRPRLERTDWDWFFAAEQPDVHRLCHYEAVSTDMMLHRLLHYTKTSAEHFQRYIFFTNFPQHFVPFIKWGRKMVADKTSGCLGIEICPGLDEERTSYYQAPQHPAVHVKFPDNGGVTLINIGVGSQNVWKVVDAIAALRPYCVALLGILGGLRQTHEKGMYVLGQDFESDCQIAGHRDESERGASNSEMSLAFAHGICQQHGISYEDVDARRKLIERIKVISTSNRGWEFRHELIRRYTSGKIGGVEMEARAVLDACDFHTLPATFCGVISDVPVFGDLRLPGSSSSFFEQSVENHVMAGIHAWELLRKDPYRMQSRSLRRNLESSPLR